MISHYFYESRVIVNSIAKNLISAGFSSVTVVYQHENTASKRFFDDSLAVSLWYVSLLINTRFRFFYFRISNC